ncbi:MAG: Z1 domain-containing protein [Alphaproteobacteria bacterium]
MLPTVFGRNIIEVRWQQVLEQLADSSDKIEVMTANGKSKSDIDYDSFKGTGRSLIAIGGDKLSRGLTLEGLSVSYFLRISRQYDSLLQMGRWFGYRRGFADLCRLYTTDDMEDWFRYMATVQNELRSQFYEMSVIKATPKQFGLKVEVHDVLEITSRDKQRHTALRSSSYAGEGKVQTVMFRDKATTEQNANVTDDFIRSLGQGTDSPTRPGSDRGKALGTLWSGVSGRQIAEYLRGLTFPPESIQVNGGKLAAYITEQLKVNELTEWTVFLAEGREKPRNIAGRDRSGILRTPRTDENGVPASTDRFIIGTALSPLDQAIDLTDAEFADALASTNAERATRKKPITDVPSGEFIRKARGARPKNGLLIIYPIDPEKALVEETDRPVIGVVVSFPDSELADDRVYRINSVAQKEEQ